MVDFRNQVQSILRPLPAVLVVLIMTTGSLPMAHGETSEETGVALVEAWMLGPLPVFSALSEFPGDTGVLPRGQQVAVMEISPGRHLPDASTIAEQSWKRVIADKDGVLSFNTPGIYWLAVNLRTSHLTEGKLSVPFGRAVFFRGEKVEILDPEKETDVLDVSLDLDRGWGTLYLRLEIPADSEKAAPVIKLTTEARADPVWTLSTVAPLTRFSESDEYTAVSRLTIANDGRWMTRRVSRRQDGLSVTGLFNGKGKLVAENPGGSGARPVAFMPSGKELLLIKSTKGTQNLLLHSLPAGPSRFLLREEPGLDLVRVSSDGALILFLSEIGFKEKDHDSGANRHWDVLRERVSDYTPVPHLHLIDTTTGLRRILTRPGDAVIDDAVFAHDNNSVFYVRTLPIQPHPWFKSEIRQINLATGQDQLLKEFTSGWEVRPQALVASPDGRSLVFLGPPDEVGPDFRPHNVYNKQVWLLDLASAQTRRITNDQMYCFASGGGLPCFDDEGRLLLKANQKGRDLLVRLRSTEKGRAPWSIEELPGKSETMDGVAVSMSGDSVILTASSPSEPTAVYYGSTGKKLHLLDEPNNALKDTWQLATAEEATFATDNGHQIDAWFYHPHQMGADGGGSFTAPESGSSPLIVYFYGGSSPTNRSFNTTHQFFAANGYGVLVVNPRGATGYGDQYADHHAGDWGPLAAADIQAATDEILAKYSWLDADRIGIYGGSYGGFMTEYLVTVTQRYAAAVSMYGISDLGTYWGQGAWGWTYGDMALGGKRPWADKQYFQDHSPLYQADKITTPLLLLHGDEDVNVTPGESVQLFTALSVLDRPVEMVTFPGEGHGISGTWENRVAHRTMMLEWFDRYLKDQPEAWSNRWE